MNKIIFATGNQHKVEEVSRINQHVDFLSLKDVDIVEDIPETGSTFRANALQKARYVFDRKQMPVLSEDSGLCIEALSGEPGVLSARYAGVEKNHAKNIQKVLSQLITQDNRKAFFVSTLCFIDTDRKDHYFEGYCHGIIAHEISGSGGFGYDPIFIPDGFNETFGLLNSEVKDKISHRKKSFALFSAFIQQANQQ